MNPQVMPFGNQPPGGYMQRGGNFPPNAGGPPPPQHAGAPPVGNFPPRHSPHQYGSVQQPPPLTQQPPPQQKLPPFQGGAPGMPPQAMSNGPSHEVSGGGPIKSQLPNPGLANQMQGLNINAPHPQLGAEPEGAVGNGPPAQQGQTHQHYARPGPPGGPPSGPPYGPPGPQTNGPPPPGAPHAPSDQQYRHPAQYMNGAPLTAQGPPPPYAPAGPRPPPTGSQMPPQPTQTNGQPMPGPGQYAPPPMTSQHQYNQQYQQHAPPTAAGMKPAYPQTPQEMYQGGGPGMVSPPQGYPPPSYGAAQPPQQPMGQGGYNQGYPGATSPPGYQQQQQQQGGQRRLDPDQLPSPIQVIEDDEKSRSGVFYTSQKGLVPPLVTTNYVTQDQGNCSPRYVRSTMYNIPVTMDMMKQTSVPFALIISPLARLGTGETAPPIVNMGEVGPVRCIRCKAYMSPLMQFVDGGRRFHCLLCKATTEVPGEYFQHLDHTGQRVDRFERPELLLGTYEFVATKDYCRNNVPPKPPAMIFVLDVSYNNVKSGLVHLLCARMKEIIRLLPRDEGAQKSNMRVGFITYSTSVHFYNIKSCLAAPQMMVVGDVNEMFMPLLDGFLCDPVESETVIDLLMTEIPRQFADTRETETILLPAIQAGLEALKASECCGKLLVFHSSLPIAEAPGKLKNRDDRKMLGSDKEKAVLAPQNTAYNNVGQDCVQAGCCVDLFVFNNSYIDLATIGQVSRLTGGEIFKYTYFQADIDGERFITDLKRNVERQIAFDAIMRVRTSTGVRATDFYGHFFMSNTTDMELAAIDCDKAVAVEVKHDDKLTEEDGVYIQIALLFTSCSGQRRLRVFNLSMKTCTQMSDLYRTCDLDTLINFFSKQGMFKLMESTPRQVKDALTNRCANILACYRKNCASPTSVGQLILPECMKLLPLYINTLMKSDAFSGGSDMTCDDRSFAMYTVHIMDLDVSVVYFYPRLLPLHVLLDCLDAPNIPVHAESLSVQFPAPIRCTAEKLQDHGVYLLDNGIHMFLWIGLSASPEFVGQVFGVPTASQVDTDKIALPVLENTLSEKVRAIVEDVREQRHRSMRLTLVKQRDKMEMVFKHFLMEDRGLDGSPSYVDFLCHMHKEIRQLLS